MFPRAVEVPAGKQRASERPVSYGSRYRIVACFALGEQRLAELDRLIMSGSHPMVSPQPEDRL